MDYKSLQTCIGVVAVYFLALTGCGLRNPGLDALGRGVTLTGKVVDGFGVAVAGATVSVGGRPGVHATTDAAGAFRLDYPGSPNDSVALQAEGPAHARAVRPYTVARVQPVPIVLQVRKLDLDSVIQLPGPGDAPLTVTVPNPAGDTRLTVSPNAMVKADGSLASGQARVRLTLWHPADALDTAPGVLYAQGNDPKLTRLQTFGMADIEISEVSQNANLLQVAPGQSLTLSVGADASQRANLAAGEGLPRLYSLDVNTGFWADEGGFDDGKLAYDSASATLTARLPHLSSWNMDGAVPTTNGGCVQGQVHDVCDPNRAIGATQVNVWFLSWEQTAVFRVKSDAQGHYCAQTGTPTVQGDQATSTHYLVTGKDGEITSQCDPRPEGCKTCVNQSSTYCNDCRMSSALGGTGTAYKDSCQPPTPSATVAPCTFCPGQAPQRCTMPGSGGAISPQACGTLKTVYIPGPDCHCDASGKCNVCTSSRGQDCDAEHPCCSNGDGTPNVCLDFKCVPPNDP